jgi:two-component system, NarL family, response regulator LiaR
MSSPIRILIADDHPIVRDGLVAILNTQPDFEVVGEASNGAELVQLARVLAPDIVLTDLEMPGLDGVEAIRKIRSTLPDVQMIVLTVFDTGDRIINSLQAGAQGYLLKGAPRSEIFAAIRMVSAGGSLLHPVASAKLLEHVRAPHDNKNGTAKSQKDQLLTEREMDVLRLLAQGKTNREIADSLNITERTVKFHVGSISSKLGSGNRTEVVTLAVQRGLISL